VKGRIEMIVKYLNDGVWGFIDNVRQVASKLIDPVGSIKRYDAELSTGEFDSAVFMDNKRLPEDIVTSNKVFSVACYDMPDEGINRHAENMIAPNLVPDNIPILAVLLYLEDCKEFDAMLIVTNQRLYLMNDKGQTIERIV
jgi:hypothetical protein